MDRIVLEPGAVGNALAAIGWALLLAAGQTGWGIAALRKAGCTLPAALAWSFGYGLGYAAVAWLLASVGLAYGLPRWVLWGVTALHLPGALFVFLELRAIGAPGLRRGWRALLPWERTVAVLLAARFAVTLTSCVLPPVLLDELKCHLPAAKAYLTLGSYSFVPYQDFHANIPSLMQLHFALGLFLGDAATARAGCFFIGCGFFAIAYRLSERLVHPRSGWVAALILGAMPMTHFYACQTLLDLGMGLFACLGILLLLDPDLYALRGRSILIGLAFGASVMVKLLAGPLVAAAALLALLPGRGRLGLRDTARCALAMVAVGAPFLLKNALATGNPLWPFLYPLFGGKYLTPEVAAGISQYFHEYGRRGFPEDLLRLPGYLLHDFHPFLVAGLIAIGGFRRQSPIHRRLEVLILSVVVGWYFGSPQVRFLMLAVVLLAGFSGWALIALRDRFPRAGLVAAIALVGFFLYRMRGPLEHTANDLVLTSDPKVLAAHLSRFANYGDSDRLNRAVRAHEVLLFADIASWYLKVPFRPAQFAAEEPRRSFAFPSAAALREFCLREGAQVLYASRNLPMIWANVERLDLDHAPEFETLFVSERGACWRLKR